MLRSVSAGVTGVEASSTYIAPARCSGAAPSAWRWYPIHLREETRVNKYERRVERGIVEFNRQRGYDWPLSVTTSTLDVSSGRDCPVAQLYGRYSTGLRRMGNRGDFWARRRGFIATERGGRVEYRYLTAIWKHRVMELKAALLEPEDSVTS